MRNIKKLSVILLIFGILMIVTGVSMAFFNYARVGNTNTLAVGRVYFTSSQGNAINLTNVFPVKSTEIENNLNVGSVTINVQGDTTYDEGIEYLISAVDVNNTINNKAVPIGISVTATNLGTSDNDYYTNRGGNTSIYKVLAEAPIYEDSHIAVGYITKGVTGINGNITVKAYIDADRIAVSDTYDGIESDSMNTKNSWVNGRVVLTETEWNSLITGGVSFKVKVEANEDVWVEEHMTFDRLIASKVSQSYVASYDDIITQNPTYTTQDQVSDSATKETVYYYTGNDAAANANVLFAGYCWQIVRTTDNGGVRILYNGVAVNNQCEATRTATKGINTISAATTQNMSAATLFGRSYDYDLTTGEFTILNSEGLPNAWNTNSYKSLIGTYTCLSNSTTCNTLYYIGSYFNNTTSWSTSYTVGDVAHFSQIGSSSFNAYNFSPALVGYMFNKEYDRKSGTKSGEYYSNATWNGTNYILTDGNGGTAPDATHHYICDSDCSKIRYYFNSNQYYILLENGITIYDALKEMINYKTNINDLDANINVYNSSIKGYLENWYKKELLNYASYIDKNTVYCNDRSVMDLGGWNPNGTNIVGTLAYLNFYQVESNNDLKCVNVTDRFSVENTNKAKLTYPIGLLTEPERILMNSLAYSNLGYWTLSPKRYDNDSSVRYGSSAGYANASVVHNIYGVRPVITLKPGTVVTNGTGTYTDPYIVGLIVTRTN